MHFAFSKLNGDVDIMEPEDFKEALPHLMLCLLDPYCTPWAGNEVSGVGSCCATAAGVRAVLLCLCGVTHVRCYACLI